MAYYDASFASKEDGSSQIVFTVLFEDTVGKASILAFASREAKLVVRLVLRVEPFAFADALNDSLFLPQDLRTLLIKNVPFHALVDSSSLFSIIIHSTCITERRLLIDLQAAREEFDKWEIS